MPRELIQRAAEDFAVTGRTLEGLAYLFEHPSSVRDNGGPAYLEALARGSATKSLRERETFPLAYFHGLTSGTAGSRSRWAGETFGPVRFRPGDTGLEFTATLSRTIGADEQLELLNDKATGDVSILAYPVKTSRRNNITWRDELALVELSLCPVGTGQHEGAKVLAVRADELVSRSTVAELRQRRRRLLVRP